MTPAGRAEAQRTAAALVGCVLDADLEGATVLLSGTSHEILAQAAVDLARWITYAIGDEDLAGFRTALTHGLQAITGDDLGGRPPWHTAGDHPQ